MLAKPEGGEPLIELSDGFAQLASRLGQEHKIIHVEHIVHALLRKTPPLSQLPVEEYVSEIFGHIVWFWSIEIIRRDMRNRITREPDAEVLFIDETR